MPSSAHLPFAPALVALALAAQDPAPAPRAPGVKLPEGPAARAFAGVGERTAPARLPPGPAAIDDASWRTPAPWQAWADAVRAEAAAAAPEPTRRAALARIALAQARWDDAWDHFAATGGDPSTCAALLPLFLPGASAESAVGAGGVSGPLPDGALLRPAPPPPSLPAAEVQLGRTWIERREMRLEGLRVGDATLAMRVALESDGILVEFEHRSGGAARVRVVLPELADFQVRVEYVDWMRQDTTGAVLELELAPGATEPHTLFGRFRPRTIPWPTNLPRALPRALAEHGLALALPADGALAETARAAGAPLASVLGFAVRAGSGAAEPFPGVRVDLADAGVAQRKLLGMVTLAERFALRGAAR